MIQATMIQQTMTQQTMTQQTMIQQTMTQTRRRVMTVSHVGILPGCFGRW
jgi:hypothetical protein